MFENNITVITSDHKLGVQIETAKHFVEPANSGYCTECVDIDTLPAGSVFLLEMTQKYCVKLFGRFVLIIDDHNGHLTQGGKFVGLYWAIERWVLPVKLAL